MDDQAKRRKIIKFLFQKARTLPPGEREGFLKKNCNDFGIQNSVQEMLNESELSLQPSSAMNSKSTAKNSGEPNQSIPVSDRYRRHEKIGRGGMGVVFRAEQIETNNRVVALKYIFPKRFGNKKRVSAFKTEIANLSKLSHPNIATIYEAGEVDDIPFFSMEYIKDSVGLTKYCDNNRLDIPSRLKLFIQVCRAVQHAHTNGIVHRDLKPSNILVYGPITDPKVKVIDFGLARSVNLEADETVSRNVCGTPAYASPEQATEGESTNALSDIFSLGAILQELLIGFNHLGRKQKQTTSFPKLLHFLRTEKFTEAERIIRDLPIDQLSVMIGNRKVSKQKLLRHLRTDLSWILKKCFQMKPEDRYDSVKSLEIDIQNFLDCKPVEARASKSLSYVWGKGLRRNAAISIAITVAFIFLIGIVESMRRMNIQERVRVQEAKKATLVERTLRKEAERNRKNAENGFNALAGIFENLNIRNPPKSFDQWTAKFSKEISKAGEKLNQDIFDDSLNYAKMLDRFSSVLVGLGDGKNAIKLARKSLAIFEELPEISPEDKTIGLYNLGQAFLADKQYEEAALLFRRSLSQMKSQFHPNSHDIIRCEANLATCLSSYGQTAEAIKHHRNVVPKFQKALGLTNRETLGSQANLANCYREMGRVKEAKKIFEVILPLLLKHHGENYYGTITSEINLGNCLNELGEYDRCINLLKKSLPRARTHLGKVHPNTITGTTTLASAMEERGELKKALELLKKIPLNDLSFTEQRMRDAYSKIGELYSKLGNHTKAIEIHKLILENLPKGLKDKRRLSAQNNLGVMYGSAKKLKKSLEIAERTVQEATEKFGRDDPDVIKFNANLALAYDRLGNQEEADKIHRSIIEKSRRNLSPSEHSLFVQNYVRKLISKNRLEEALVQLKELASYIQENGGGESLLFEQINLKLASLLVKNRKFQDAEKILKPYQSMPWKELSTKGPILLNTLGFVGQYYYETRKFSKSIPIFEKILKVKESRKKRVDKNSLFRAKLNLAANYKASGRVEESIPLYEDLFSQLGDFPEDGKAVRHSLCDAYFQCKMGNKAREVVIEILKPVRQQYKNDFNRLHYSLGAIATKLTNSGGYRQSRELLEESIELILKEKPNHSRLFYSKILLGENFYFDAVSRPKNEPKSTVSLLLKEAKKNLMEGFEGMKNAKNFSFSEQARRKVLVDAAKSLIKVFQATRDKKNLVKWNSILQRLESQMESL